MSMTGLGDFRMSLLGRPKSNVSWITAVLNLSKVSKIMTLFIGAFSDLAVLSICSNEWFRAKIGLSQQVSE